MTPALAMTDRPGPLTRRDLPPGPGYPRTVQTTRWLLDGPRFMRRCQQRFGDVFTLDLIPTLGRRSVHRPRRGADGVFIRSRAHQAGVQDRPGGGPDRRDEHVLAERCRNMRQRRLMLPTLRGGHLQRYQELVAHATLREINSWPAGKPFALCPPGFGLDCSPQPQSQDC